MGICETSETYEPHLTSHFDIAYKRPPNSGDTLLVRNFSLFRALIKASINWSN